MRDEMLSDALLGWYDHHARSLPWRIPPAARQAGVAPDPYRVWLSEIMLQQTTVVVVKSYYQTFTNKWPDVQSLAAADDADVMAAWAGLGYYARARNLLKCARMVTDTFGGVFPSDQSALQKLPGIGPYTSAAIAAIAYDVPAVVVDGNVERVMARLFDVHTPLPAAKRELTSLAASLTPAARAGDYAQSVMDLGATICTPRAPACGICPWRDPCAARKAGTAAELPRKTPKSAKPVRHGVAYVARRKDGAYLLEKRPAKGLLGGMMGWPGSEWLETMPQAENSPFEANWCEVGEVRHSFTHFHLRLQVRIANVPLETDVENAFFMPPDDFDPESLPSVMRKVYAIAQSALRL